MASDSRQPVEFISEANYMFRLSHFTDPLLRWLSSRPDVILPTSRLAEVTEAVRKGLADLSVSRSAQQVSWGIPVPGDPEHTMYVWVDALSNYLTVTGYPWASGQRYLRALRFCLYSIISNDQIAVYTTGCPGHWEGYSQVSRDPLACPLDGSRP